MIPIHSFADRTVAVFGLARSGGAAARALAAGGARVLVWDDRADRCQEYAGAGIETVNLSLLNFHQVDALVLSPGVPFTHPEPHPVVRRAQGAGCQIIGDIELLARERPTARLVGITGTNGKSTTAALTAHILDRCGWSVQLGGNIGRPVLDLDPFAGEGAYVLELSSYQIDLAPSLACDVAALTNISADHLDRHGSMAGYVAVKKRLFTGQRPGQTAIIGIDDAYGASIYDELVADRARTVVPISVGRHLEHGVFVRDGVLFDTTIAAAPIDLRQARALRGTHNWQNAAVAYAAARALGVTAAAIAKAVPEFPGLAHRMEFVATVDGVPYVNDSKATNADAAAKALATYDDIYWIAGGRPKEGGITRLIDLFPRIRHAFLIGEASEAFAQTLAGLVPVTRSGDLARAIADAHRAAAAHPGGVVLLSPACASFDQFADFEARGDAFRRLVLALPGARLAAPGGSA